MKNVILHGDSKTLLKDLPDDSIDSCVTDPPYGLKFMGKKWDYDVPDIDTWKEVYRVLKPGGHMLVACGTRTQHRMVVNIEDAGFEIRDVIQWLYGSGFPKSMDLSKAIDKAAGVERTIIGTKNNTYDGAIRNPENHVSPAESSGIGKWGLDKTPHGLPMTVGATDSAKQGEGWGTALKPACELWTLCRKPIEESTIAKNVIKYGTGGINIDDCRVELADFGEDKRLGGKGTWGTENAAKNVYQGGYAGDTVISSEGGRFPANVIHDGSEEVLALFPDAKGQQGDLIGHDKETQSPNGIFGTMPPRYDMIKRKDNTVSAARFFYCAKASKKEREGGLEGLDATPAFEIDDNTDRDTVKRRKNFHPTVKPIALMRYLVRLITPKGGTVIDPFAGSFSTLCASTLEGFDGIGIDNEEAYVNIGKTRVEYHERLVKG